LDGKVATAESFTSYLKGASRKGYVNRPWGAITHKDESKIHWIAETPSFEDVREKKEKDLSAESKSMNQMSEDHSELIPLASLPSDPTLHRVL
jgi:hypothetical protein